MIGIADRVPTRAACTSTSRDHTPNLIIATTPAQLNLKHNLAVRTAPNQDVLCRRINRCPIRMDIETRMETALVVRRIVNYITRCATADRSLKAIGAALFGDRDNTELITSTSLSTPRI